MARTVAAGTITQTLIDAQNGTQRKPYIRVVINSVDYSSRVLVVEHHEEPYRDWATIILSNSDRGLDSVAIASNNLLGYRFRIGYGLTTGAGDEYSETADLWVKKQQMVSSPGQLLCVLYCEGMWFYLREQRMMASGSPPSTVATGNPDVVEDDPNYIDTFDATYTIYSLIEMMLEGAFSWTLNATPSPDDSILNSLKPVYQFSQLPDAASVLRDWIQMTKCYLRAKANLIWEIVYPQSTDAVDETYYSDQAPYFLEYTEALNLVIPNKYVVFAGNPLDATPWPEPVIVGETADYVAGADGPFTVKSNYVEVMDFELAPTITTQGNADDRADALVTRRQAEQLAAYLIVYHDARVELYDRIAVEDNRK